MLLDVGPVDSRIGTDEPASVFHHDEPGTGSNHHAAFLEDQLNEAWVLVCVRGKIQSLQGGANVIQPDNPALRLGDDFLRHDQHVPRLDAVPSVRAREEQVGKRVARANQRQPANGEERNHLRLARQLDRGRVVHGPPVGLGCRLELEPRIACLEDPIAVAVSQQKLDQWSARIQLG